MSIRGSWFRLRRRSVRLKPLCALIVLIASSSGFFTAGLFAAAATSKSKKHAKKKTVSKVQSPKNVGAAGLIAVAQHQLELGNYAAAADYATSASKNAPILDDYAQYIRAQAEYALRNFADVNEAATRVFNQTPLSPFAGPAAALAVKADLDANSPKQALELVKKYFDVIPHPQSELLLARCLDATGDLPQSAEYYQRVYYQYPTSKEATDAANALVDLKQRAGDAYPTPMPNAMLTRAKK